MTTPRTENGRAGSDRSLTVLHVIPGLEHGGAEHNLLNVVERSLSPRVAHSVVNLTAGGALAHRFDALGVRRHDLGFRRSRPSPGPALRFLGILRRSRPDMVQGWLYDGNLLATAARLVPGLSCGLAWSVLHSSDDLAGERLSIRISFRMGALLSRVPNAVVYNAVSAARGHERMGFRRDSRRLIPNGFDVERFRPRPDAARSVRKEIGIPEESPLVGTVGRDHPVKDHPTFLEAAGRLVGSAGDDGIHFLMAGPGIHADNPDLAGDVRRLGLDGRVHLLGPREDVPHLLAALDIFVLSSVGEAFPSVLGEAMACGIPCVTTDVGDAARVLGGAGEVVPAGDPGRLARACRRLLGRPADERRRLGERARQRIVTEFSLDSMTSAYLDLWRELAPSPQGRAPESPG